MGKMKNEMRKIHRKKAKKAKEKGKKHLKGESAFHTLGQRTKRMLAKRRRTEKSRQSA